ncbi:MAG: Lysine exporter protein [Phycisphaerales bacterium]|nr:Lysine exporter protein [Phycisphaerales bacterium]
MFAELPSRPLLTAFLAASFILAITPGPGVLYIVTRSLAQGRRAGLASVAGVAAGNLGNAIGAAVGLAAWFAVSSFAFTVVKYAGAAYLIYLGLRTLLSKGDKANPVAPSSATPARIFRDGLVVALLNPKTAIFFAAFLPQFMGRHATSASGCILLGAMFVAIAATTDSLYALSAGSVAPALEGARTPRRIGRGLSGGVFLGLGLYTAFSGQRRAA